MRELDRNQPESHPTLRCAVIGAGRLGSALAPGLASAGHLVEGPLGRGADADGCDVALLCVPDGEIADAAACIAPGPLVGHCSGALGLNVLGEREGFSLHPLMTVTGPDWVLSGAGCAVDGSTPGALATARSLAEGLGMHPVHVEAEDRAAYHAAASTASNYVVTLLAAAERLAATADLERAHLAPLVRAAVDNWEHLGAERALTGPVARGDEATVERQRAAVQERAPELLYLFEELTRATRALAASRAEGVAA